MAKLGHLVIRVQHAEFAVWIDYCYGVGQGCLWCFSNFENSNIT